MVSSRRAIRYSAWLFALMWARLRKGGLGFSLGVFLASGLLFQDKFVWKDIFWSGPLRILALAWIATLVLILNVVDMLKDVWKDLHRVRSGGAARLADWQVPSNWDTFEEGFEVVLAPSIREPRASGVPGWRSYEIYMRDLGEFDLPPRLAPVYQAWLPTVKPEKLAKDGYKYVLVNTPSSLSDQHNLSLDVKRTLWSKVTTCSQYIQDGVEGRKRLFSIIDPSWTERRKPKISFDHAELPTSLCLHAVVMTSDNRVLAVQRPDQQITDYHPLAWSISFEEQLADQDFLAQDGTSLATGEIAAKWLRRAVAQEVLGFDHVDEFFSTAKARFMSLAIEEQIGNPFITVYVPVSCTSVELRAYLVKAPDRGEVCSFHFIDLNKSFDDVEKILCSDRHLDGNGYHPTSKYRLRLLAELLSGKRLDQRM